MTDFTRNVNRPFSNGQNCGLAYFLYTHSERHFSSFLNFENMKLQSKNNNNLAINEQVVFSLSALRTIFLVIAHVIMKCIEKKNRQMAETLKRETLKSCVVCVCTKIWRT